MTLSEPQALVTWAHQEPHAGSVRTRKSLSGDGHLRLTPAHDLSPVLSPDMSMVRRCPTRIFKHEHPWSKANPSVEIEYQQKFP